MQKQESQNLGFLSQTIEAWEKYLLYKGYNEKTVYVYKIDVCLLARFLEEKGIKSMSKAKSEHMQAFFESRECKPITMNRYLASIKSFLKYCLKKSLVKKDILEGVEVPIFRRKKINVPSIEEVEKVMEQPNVCLPTGVRDRAIMELIYSSGLRISEVCKLQIRDVHENSVTIHESKRGKSRTVPMNATAKYWLNEYINLYRGKAPGLVFITKNARPMKTRYTCRLVKGYVASSGLKDITPHTFRHACATHFLDQGADIRMIQEILGHSNLNTTQRYTHYSSKSLEDSFNKFSPRRERNLEEVPYI